MTKPKYGEEIRKMRLAGDEKRKANGTYLDLTGASSKATGGISTIQRAELQNYISVATAELAQGNHEAWAECLHEMLQMTMSFGWQKSTFLQICSGIEESAVEISGNPQAGDLGRHFLQERKDRLFFGQYGQEH